MNNKTTYFYKKNGGLSSVRVTMDDSKHKTSINTYPSSGKGGTSFKNSSITIRMNNSGASIGMGLKCGNNTTYFGSNGNVTKNLPSF